MKFVNKGTTMKYRVSARDWELTNINGTSLEKRFGKCDSVHELSDREIVEAIIMFGRATIEANNTSLYMYHICFENMYD